MTHAGSGALGPGPAPIAAGIEPAAFAELLCGYCLDVAAGEQVVVRSSTLAAPLLLELQRAVLARGAWPLLRVELPGQAEAYYANLPDELLDRYPPLALHEARKAACTLNIQAPENTRALAGIDPARLARANLAREPIRDAVMKTRWCSTLWPTAASAQQAGMGLRDFESFVSRALFLDRPDPVVAWFGLREFQDELIERLRRARELRIEAPGTDLVMSVARRKWVNSDGRRNMPSGEVFSGPVEDSVRGRIRFSIASSPSGVEVDGVELEFRDGEVIASSAERGEPYLREMLGTDEGARRVGEIGIGTNFGIDRSIGAILFDEKIGGTVHVALGRSYPETGAQNRSALHWDLICDLRTGGRLTVDGEVISENGKFA